MSDTWEPAVGDLVEWYDDGHGRGIAPDQPGAMRCSGTISDVLSGAEGQPVAYFVRRYSRISGTYAVAVRPDLGHRLVLLPPEPAD
ncbi:hypothetical protein [Nocardia brasiliensis]|uniref:hypothetical protein n=1 Tax=Nocardia brasiliensis TaxID=37326 RepID=UPI003D92474C